MHDAISPLTSTIGLGKYSHPFPLFIFTALYEGALTWQTKLKHFEGKPHFDAYSPMLLGEEGEAFNTALTSLLEESIL